MNKPGILDGETDRQTDGQKGRQTNGQTEGQIATTDQQMNSLTVQKNSVPIGLF